ncbi:MAG: hypothetical protein R3C54_17080 [Parvularculaceae bacterium]
MSEEATNHAEAERKRADAELLLSFLDDIAPTVFAAIVFLSGAAMLGASAAPDFFQNRSLLRIIAPLPVIEASHFLSSVIGTLMLFVAAGLRQRLSSAWLLGVILLGAGAVFSLLSGGHYARVVASTVVMVSLASRAAFYRQPGLRDEPRRSGLGRILLVIGAIASASIFRSSMSNTITTSGGHSRAMRMRRASCEAS